MSKTTDTTNAKMCKGGSTDGKTWCCLGASCTVGDWTICRRTIAKRGYKLKLVTDDGTDT